MNAYQRGQNVWDEPVERTGTQEENKSFKGTTPMCAEHIHRRSIYSLAGVELSHQAEGKRHADTQREDEGERPTRQLTNEPGVAREGKRHKGPSFQTQKLLIHLEMSGQSFSRNRHKWFLLEKGD